MFVNGRREFATFWAGRELGPYEMLCLRSFVARGFPLTVYSFQSGLEVPDGIELKSPSDFFSPQEIIENPERPGSYALISNLFRYRLLRRYDVTWVDADVFALGPQFPSVPYLFSNEEPLKVNGAVFGAPMKSEFLAALEAEAEERIISGHVRAGNAGPNLLTEKIDELNLWGQVLPTRTFYPVHYSEVWKFFDPDLAGQLERRLSRSVTVHLWNTYFQLDTFSLRHLRPPTGSWLWKQFRLLDMLDVFRAGEILDLDWVRQVWRPELDSPRSAVRKLALSCLGIVHSIGGKSTRRGLQEFRRKIGL